MKTTFSKDWISSSQPRKQRKFRFNAPLHARGKFLHANLAKDLREKYTRKSLRVRKGDKVKVMRGQFKGKVGVVNSVDLTRSKIFVAGVDLMKKDGSKTAMPVQPSNVMIMELQLDDKKRVLKLKAEVKNG